MKFSSNVIVGPIGFFTSSTSFNPLNKSPSSKAFKTEPKKLWFYYETNFQVILPQNFYGYPPDLTIKMNESN
mgnify:CR=1 FL=1